MGQGEKTAKELEAIFSKGALEASTKYRDSLLMVDGAIRKLRQGAEVIMEPLGALSDGITKSSNASESFNRLILSTGDNLARAAQLISDDAAGAFRAIAETIVATNNELTNLGKQLDSETEGIRSTREEFFKLASTFGEGYEKSQDLRIGLGNLAEEVSSRSVISFQEMKKAIDDAASGFGSAGLHYSEFFKEVDAGTEKFSVMEAAILLNRRSGEGMSQTMRFLSEAVKKSGVSVEDAVSQYSSFFDVAEKTGLKFDEVKNSLNSVASSYSKIGLNAEFARPIIETFSRSLSEAGLGISNATSLSETLSRSLMGVAGSYEKAYLMVQKGGLDVGTSGGGVLGASIAMRANIMDAEESGDQSEIGLQMAQAMKKTIESMSQGSLVNIREARDSPGLTNQYAIQEKLMMSQYGMDQDTASRTIEMLQKLDDTTIMGNKDLRDNLGKNLEDQLKNQDENIGYQERIEANTSNMFASSVLTNEILMKIVTGSNRGAAKIAGAQSGLQAGLFDPGMDLATDLAESANDMIDKAEGKMVDMQKKLQIMSVTQASDESISVPLSISGNIDPNINAEDISDQFTKGDLKISQLLKDMLDEMRKQKTENTTFSNP